MKRILYVSALFVCTFLTSCADKPVKLIFETDMGNDVDDVLCQVLINQYVEQGSVDCLMMGINKTGTAPAAFTDLVNTFYGHGDIPIALARNGVQEPDSSSYAYIVSNMKGENGQFIYPRSYGDYSSLPDAVTMYRKVLSGQEDGSVVIASVGFSTNLAQLMETGADQYSPLSGMELIRKKVKSLAVMAGSFNGLGHGEYNVIMDIPAARKVFAEWPTEVIISPWELGVDVLYPVKSIQNDFTWVKRHPMVDAFKNYGDSYPSDRPSWDPTVVLYAVEGTKWFNVSAPIDVRVDDEGRTLFTPNPNGNRYFLYVTPEQIKAIEDYFVRMATRH
ncbi:MAG: nucleoside hydrolase [Alistipes sp.]|nr:nucleoside hydrolase [Candidatus Minthomonas equi]